MCRISLVVVALAALVPAQTPKWIWGHWASGIANRPDGERCYARRSVDLGKAGHNKALLEVTCDNRYRIWLNGRRIGQGDNWAQGQVFNVARHLRKGENVVAVEASNDGGPAGLLVRFRVDGKIVGFTDKTWLTSRASADKWQTLGFDAKAAGWKPASELAPFGSGPWGKPSFGGRAGGRSRRGGPGTPQDFAPLPGFEAREIAAGFGSLIALCLDDQDRPIVSVERAGVLRLHDDDEDGVYEREEVITDKVKSCQGLLYSRNGFYLVGAGPEGPGLYRLEEGGGDNPQLLGGFIGGMGEHGPHAIIEGPNDRLYGVIGNHTKLKAEWSPASPYKLHDEGHLLPRYLDPRGHARKIRSPGGLIYSVDREGKDWQVIAAGFRNSYDIAFNRHGALFTYDSDMEWDIGMPWYRPTRLYHVVPGGEYGWRTGSSKWPDIYPDSLPAAIDCGRGSPCGVVMYDGKTFPERFQGALFGADWAQGRILAFHLEASGDTYKGRTEVLLSGRPLNVTDLAIARDGSLIFTCGGRGTRGSLGRLQYTKPVGVQAVRPRPTALPAASTSVSELVAVIGKPGPENRFSRFVAARILERTPDDLPAGDALGDTTFAETVVAAARAGVDRWAPDAIAMRLLGAKDVEVRRALLRGLQLALRKKGASLDGALAGRLLKTYPTGDRAADRELAAILAHTDPEGTVDRLLEALEAEKSRAEQIHLAVCLRSTNRGWTRAHKQRLLQWIVKAQEWNGGASFRGFVKAIRDDVVKKFDDGDRSALAGLLAKKPGQGRVHLVAGAPVRDFTRTLDFLRNSLGTERRSLHEGARVFARSCAVCHKYGAQGAGVGPDLTTAANRYTLEDLLTTIVDPSREISDQYRALDVFTKEDDLFTGLVVSENDEKIVLLQGTGEQVEVAVADIDTRRFAKTSGMPEGLLDGLSLEEVADLFFYLRSGTPIAEAPKTSAWTAMFNGKDLSGWSGKDGLWKVENGVVVGELKNGKKNTFLISEKEYGDFVLQFEMLLEEGNSGLQFRSERLDDHVMRGYQADAGAQYWGSLYEERGRGMLNQSERVDWEPAFEKGGWNHFVVEAKGDRIRITLNGCPTTVIRDKKSAKGRFGFQLHAGKRTKIMLRNVMIRKP